MSGLRPKRALLAYCALAERLTVPGAGVTQALTPFLAEVCQQFAGELFNASKFSDAMNEWYGIRVPRLAALGLAEQLADEGLLQEVSGHARGTVYRFAPVIQVKAADGMSPLTEAEIEKVLDEFVRYCESEGELPIPTNAVELHSAFLDRLLHVDSMKILSRREASISTKKTVDTIVLGKPREPGTPAEKQELRLDFLTSQFLLDLRGRDPHAFELVSNIAFANMAAEALACFQEPIETVRPLSDLVIYIDSPLLLDMLGVNEEYAEYGKELLETIHSSGATPALMDHSVAEAEAAVYGRVHKLRSGANQWSTRLGTTAAPLTLSALLGHVGERAEKRLKIALHKDPEINLARRSPVAVGDIEAQINSRMQSWRNADAKEHDRQSVWSLIALRDARKPVPRICDAKWLLLTKNTALVGIANDSWKIWLKDTTNFSASHVEKWAPVAMSDKQFAGYVWARSGGQSVSMSRARLLANCSAAVRPRADVKAKAYNLVLELSGKDEADDIAALFEDREGSSALMRATRGDPEDVTAARLPFIIEKVKLAAGEFAAEKARLEGERVAQELATTHEVALEALNAKAASERLEKENEAAQAATRLKEERDARLIADMARQAAELRLRTSEKSEAARKARVYKQAFLAGKSRYRQLRWLTAILFAGLTVASSTLLGNFPAINSAVAGLVALAGFWFVPDLLNAPYQSTALRRVASQLATLDRDLPMPTEAPDFSKSDWISIESTSRPLATSEGRADPSP